MMNAHVRSEVVFYLGVLCMLSRSGNRERDTKSGQKHDIIVSLSKGSQQY